jgi:hypothetical protein
MRCSQAPASSCFSVLPGFGPAAEPLLFRQKWPKPLTPRPVSLDWTDAKHEKAGQLAALRQGPLIDKSVRPWGLAAGVGQGEGYGSQGIPVVGQLEIMVKVFCEKPAQLKFRQETEKVSNQLVFLVNTNHLGRWHK